MVCKICGKEVYHKGVAIILYPRGRLIAEFCLECFIKTRKEDLEDLALVLAEEMM